MRSSWSRGQKPSPTVRAQDVLPKIFARWSRDVASTRHSTKCARILPARIGGRGPRNSTKGVPPRSHRVHTWPDSSWVDGAAGQLGATSDPDEPVNVALTAQLELVRFGCLIVMAQAGVKPGGGGLLPPGRTMEAGAAQVRGVCTLFAQVDGREPRIRCFPRKRAFTCRASLSLREGRR
jgi:hypothetical protein